MPAQRKYPEELRERAVKMMLEIREQEGKGRPQGRPARPPPGSPFLPPPDVVFIGTLLRRYWPGGRGACRRRARAAESEGRRG
jgi:hypothetical protein